MSDKIHYFEGANITPEPLLLAAGKIPMKIIGNSKEEPTLADAHVPSTHCFFARSSLNEGLKGLPDLAGIVVSHTCDCTNRQYDIWEANVDTPFIHWLNVPIHRDEPAKKFYRKEILHLKTALEKQFNIEITDEAIRQAIKEVNRNKRALQELSAFRKTGQLKYSEMLLDVIAATTGKVWADSNYLPNRIEEVKNRQAEELELRTLLTGSIVTDPLLPSMLEECGFSIVRDDLKLGESYYRVLYDEELDPIDALVEYPFSIPTYNNVNPPDPKVKELHEVLESEEIQCLINQVMEYCEPMLFDSVFLEKKAKEMGIPYLFVDRGFQNSTISSLRTKFEAFAEMVRGNKEEAKN